MGTGGGIHGAAGSSRRYLGYLEINKLYMVEVVELFFDIEAP